MSPITLSKPTPGMPAPLIALNAAAGVMTLELQQRLLLLALETLHDEER
ncbi:hypothetical protein [Rhizobium viscosum]|uniref:Uncharacterized protein n=1 Tax=Rhizobium viscosum TaxID=1673 RepID=A0ABR9IZM5_RHIVS|nr:hypothetical protein [Rhizobium viscosum]MBE1508252.1 hypothetical protein [Rhizobium viscosum]